MLSGAKPLLLFEQLANKQVLPIRQAQGRRCAQDDTHDRLYSYFRDTTLASMLFTLTWFGDPAKRDDDRSQAARPRNGSHAWFPRRKVTLPESSTAPRPPPGPWFTPIFTPSPAGLLVG